MWHLIDNMLSYYEAYRCVTYAVIGPVASREALSFLDESRSHLLADYLQISQSVVLLNWGNHSSMYVHFSSTKPIPKS